MPDLTKVIDSWHRASVIAHVLLRLAAPERAAGPQPACVEPVLAALLYAASPLDTGRGLGWVYDLLTTRAEHNLSAAVDAAGARVQARRLRHYDGLEPGHRQSVMVTLLHALGPWLDRPHPKAS